jgi:ABC-type multidrug transport system ATPase subunit
VFPNGAPPNPGVVGDHLAITYGERPALDRFSLDVPAGSLFGLLGPNGSGKSTFLTLIASMQPAPAGAYRVFGEPPHRAQTQRVGVVFQENTLEPVATVRESLDLSARLFGIKDDRDGRIRRRLEEVNLDARAGDPVSSLSGGMRRRLEVARALLHDPDLLLMDEPTTGIDPEERQAIWDLIQAERRGGRTVLVATNDLHEADGVCDTVAFIRDGRVVASGTPAELKRGLRAESVRFHWPRANGAVHEIERWDGIGSVTVDGEWLYVSAEDAAPVVARVFNTWPGAVNAVSIDPSSLEDAYFHHVGTRLPGASLSEVAK